VAEGIAIGIEVGMSSVRARARALVAAVGCDARAAGEFDGVTGRPLHKVAGVVAP